MDALNQSEDPNPTEPTRRRKGEYEKIEEGKKGEYEKIEESKKGEQLRSTKKN